MVTWVINIDTRCVLYGFDDECIMYGPFVFQVWLGVWLLILSEFCLVIMMNVLCIDHLFFKCGLGYEYW